MTWAHIVAEAKRRPQLTIITGAAVILIGWLVISSAWTSHRVDRAVTLAQSQQVLIDRLATELDSARAQGAKVPTPEVVAAGVPGPAEVSPPVTVAPGIPGERGEAGSAGLPGATGATGGKGDTGATGDTGLSGAQGEAGAIGPKGPQGDPGATGANGADGAEGPSGPTGASGPGGPQGEPGVAGPDGPQGVQGVQGDQGPQGIQGEPGLPGTAEGEVRTFTFLGITYQCTVTNGRCDFQPQGAP